MTSPDILLSELKKKNKKATLNYVRERFFAKECRRFVPKPNKVMPDGSPKCHCGGTEDDHLQSLQASSPVSAFWCDDDLVKIPTNAFGKIAFMAQEAQKSARYVRLSDDSKIGEVVELMVKYWHMTSDSPELLISVIGDGQDFAMPASMKNNIFNRGLIPAAEVTRGWITTFGLHMGVAKAVGEAICEGQLYFGKLGRAKRIVQCIGLAPWGFVRDKDTLVCNKAENLLSEYQKVEYGVDPFVRKNCPVALNPHHTHFLLIDNGIRNKNCNVANFRSLLEKKISEPLEAGGLGIPVVCILIGGDQSSIKYMERSAAVGLPVLILQGTRRAADVISHAYRQFKSLGSAEILNIPPHFEDDIRKRVEKTFYSNISLIEDRTRTKISSTVQEIISICRKPNVYLIDTSRGEGDAATAILLCLLECQSADLHKKLRLTLHWQRCDVAQAKIFSDPHFRIHDPEIKAFFTEALIENQLEFVKTFIDQGFAIFRYLTLAQLRQIYRQSLEKPNFLCQLLKISEDEVGCPASGNICLSHLHDFLKKLTRRFDHPTYANDGLDSEAQSTDGFYMEKPFQDLLIWALLLYRIDMALYFWEQCDDPLITSIAATLLCDRLSAKAQKFSSELSVQYAEAKKSFEAIARKLIDLAFLDDKEKASKLIHLTYEIWGDCNCMELAAISDSLEFLASPCCQATITGEWKLGFDASGWKIFLSTFTCIPVIYWINFQSDFIAVNEVMPYSSSCSTGDTPILKRTPSKPHPSTNRDATDEAATPFILAARVSRLKKKKLPCLTKLYKFYTSPVVTFTNHTFWYLLFLMLHAHVLLFSFRWSMTTADILLNIWILTFFCEFARTAVFAHRKQTVLTRILDYLDFSSFAMWNSLEMVNLSISLLIFCLRWFQVTFATARLLLAINFIIYMFRLYKMFMVNSYLGPKVIMMIKMTRDLLMFMMLLIVLNVSYSVSSQALLHPRRLYYPGIFYDIFNHGIWEIFGDLDAEITAPNLPQCVTTFSNETSLSAASALMDMEPAYLKTRDCNVRNWSVPMLLAVYLFFGNILLVNMLIAIFASIFENVQQHSEYIWKSLMYYLVVEHKEKPFLPPPFIILSHTYRIIRFCCIKRKSDNDSEAEILEKNREQDAKFLGVFESECRNKYLEEKKSELLSSSDTMLKTLNENVSKISKIVTELQLKGANAKARTAHAPPRGRPLNISAVDEEDGGWVEEKRDKPTEPKSPTEANQLEEIIFH